MHEVDPVELLLPIAIGFDLIDEGGSLFAAVAAQIALAVSFQVQPTDPAPAVHGTFPNPGVYSAALPFDVAWKSDIHRQ
jgi:hypothetical protein